MRWLALMFLASPAWAESLAVPSGQFVLFYDRIVETETGAGHVWRYRFLAPEIARDGGSVGIDTALGDIEALCANVALADVAASSDPPEQVVISLMDRPVPFGQPAPEATQFFEAFSVQDGTCTWEGF